MGWRTEMEVMATTRPQPWVTIAGTAALHMATTDNKLSSSAAGYASTAVLAKLPTGGPPALVTRMSIPPSRAVASAMSAVAPSTVLTSATSACAPGIVALAAARRSASRPEITTTQPAACSACAVPSPSPADDAATTARRPEIPRSSAVMSMTLSDRWAGAVERPARWVPTRVMRAPSH